MSKDILFISTKGGTGKSTLCEGFRQLLSDAQVVDLDPQQTHSAMHQLADHVPKPLLNDRQATSKYVLYDTPPYNAELNKALLNQVDHIVIPVNLGYTDLVALTTLFLQIKKEKAIRKTLLVFNGVRKPITNEAKELIKCFKSSFKELKICDTMLSRLDDFRRVFKQPLPNGKAKEQLKDVLKQVLACK